MILYNRLLVTWEIGCSSASPTIVPYCVSIMLSVTDLQIKLEMSTCFKPSRDENSLKISLVWQKTFCAGCEINQSPPRVTVTWNQILCIVCFWLSSFQDCHRLLTFSRLFSSMVLVQIVQYITTWILNTWYVPVWRHDWLLRLYFLLRIYCSTPTLFKSLPYTSCLLYTSPSPRDA